MVSKSVILNIFLASGVLAVPSSSARLAARLARRHVVALNEDTTSENWAGAFWNEPEGTFNTFSGVVTVPHLTGPDGSAFASVGIDGSSCEQVLLQIGIDFTLDGGKGFYGVIENLSTGQLVIQELAFSNQLCRKDVEWITEDYQINGNLVPFVNFGQVTFTSATATGSGGSSYTPDGATITNIQQNSNILTSVSTSGDTVTITYV